MAYNPTIYVNDSTPAISAENLNHSEQGILNNDTAITKNQGWAERSIAQLSSGNQNVLAIDGEWTRGGISNSGVPSYTRTNRVLNDKIVNFDREITLKASTGFNFNRYYYDSASSSTSSSSGADLTTLTIPAGQYFRILIKRTTESNSEVANIPEFTSAVTLSMATTDEIKAINIFDKISTSGFRYLSEDKGQLPAEYKHGGVLPGTGELAFNSKTKIVSTNIMQFDKDVFVYAKSGYLFSIYYYNADGTYDQGTTTHSFIKISAQRKFRIVIQNDPISSSTVSIPELASAVYCETKKQITKTSNLFNQFTVVPNVAINANTGEEVANTDYITSAYIEVNPETNYALTNKYIDSIGFLTVAYYDVDKKFIQRITLTSSNRYVATPNYAKYVRLSGQYWNISVAVSMFVEGNTLPTTYQKYAIQNDDIGLASRINSLEELKGYKHKGKVCNYTDPFMFEENISPDDVTSINAMTYDEIIALYDSLAETYSTYITKESIGTASDEETTLYMYTFKPSAIADAIDTTRKCILVSGVHGGEKTGIYCLYRTMKTICESWRDNEKVADIHRGMTFVVIPCVNPYGMNNSSRLNANGVNISRNFSLGWTYIAPGEDNNYSGDTPLSEPETKAVNDVMIVNADADFFCSFHNFWGNSYAYWDTTNMVMTHQLANEHNIVMTNAFYKQGLNPATGEYFGHADNVAPGGSEAMQPLLYNMRGSIYEVCARDLSNNENTPQAVTMGVEVQLNWLLMNYYSRFDMFE